jgi:AcrR family transcriptional regulator
MSQGTFRRARRPEQKQERREAIVVAARKLAVRSGVRDVSLGCIAAEVGLAKSNVVRYFSTREEIYLELTAREWHGWEHAVVDRLRDVREPDDIIDALVETLEQRPLLCDLMSQCATILEHNVSLEAARAFKLALVDYNATIGAAVAAAYPGLTVSEATELAGAAAGLAGLLYPMANPPPVMAELYAQEPAIAAAFPQFVPTMKRMLTALAAGLPILR